MRREWETLGQLILSVMPLSKSSPQGLGTYVEEEEKKILRAWGDGCLQGNIVLWKQQDWYTY